MGHLLIRSVFLLVFFLPSVLLCQRNERFPRAPGQAVPVFLQFVDRPSQSDEKSHLEVFYRIPYRFFIFVRNTDLQSPDPLMAGGDLVLEVRDSSNNDIIHESKHVLVTSSEPTVELPDERYLQGMLTYDIRPGTYEVNAELNDRESDRRYIYPHRRLVLRKYAAVPIEFSDVMFIAPVDSIAGSIPVHTFNFGGDIPFGKTFSAALDLRTSLPMDSVRISYSIAHRQAIGDQETPILDIRDTVSPPLIRMALTPSLDSDRIDYDWIDSTSPNRATIILPIHSDSLQQGRYSLQVTASIGDTTRATSQDFDIRWFDMPAALHSLPFAVDALQYIADEKTFHELQDASGKLQKSLFDQFWRAKDPSPGTAYNEMMAEYYRRVDHAFAAFGTLHQPNGVRSGRGKAYILYGPPASIERSLAPGSVPTETWNYPALHQKLVFTDERRSGDYQLEANIKIP